MERGAGTFRLLFCSFRTKYRKSTYILVAVMSFNAEISILWIKLLQDVQPVKRFCLFWRGVVKGERCVGDGISRELLYWHFWAKKGKFFLQRLLLISSDLLWKYTNLKIGRDKLFRENVQRMPSSGNSVEKKDKLTRRWSIASISKSSVSLGRRRLF